MFDYPVAALAQFGFFFFSFYLFGKHTPAKAGALAVLTGLLFLPDVTLIRVLDVVPMDKNKIVFLGALLGLIFRQNKHFLEARPGSTLVLIMLPLLLINIIGWQTNLSTLLSQGELQPGLSFAWVLGQSIDDFFRFALPFIVAKALITSAQDLRTFFYIGVGLGLIYTFLAVFELVMAIPFRVFQLSDYLYSVPVRPQFRYGLTEPVVFLSLGHSLATFMVFPFVAAIALLKSHATVDWKGITRVRLITFVGLLSTLKVASTLFGLAAAAGMTFFKTRLLSTLLWLAALFVLTYPMMQVVDAFPEDVLVSIASEYNAERGRSFAGRFYEEEFILDRMGSRMLFGWGHFGRIPDADIVGADSGEPGLDAWWVIRLGMSGLVGVLFVLILLTIPVFSIRRRFSIIESEETRWLLCGLMICLVIRIADLLLNGWWNSLPVFFAGALMGISLAIKENPYEALNLVDGPQMRPSRPDAAASQTRR
ncbi:MAG: hypothetical protein NXH95_00355 [Pseudomonadaceae bacterium]|nr:hypothetical protein [Pseudomonadaceae bacterium]